MKAFIVDKYTKTGDCAKAICQSRTWTKAMCWSRCMPPA